MRKDETRHAWRSKLSGVCDRSGEFSTTSARRAAMPSRPRNWLVDTVDTLESARPALAIWERDLFDLFCLRSFVLFAKIARRARAILEVRAAARYRDELRRTPHMSTERSSAAISILGAVSGGVGLLLLLRSTRCPPTKRALVEAGCGVLMVSLPIASVLYENSRRRATPLQQPSYADRLVTLELRVAELDDELQLLGRSGWT